MNHINYIRERYDKEQLLIMEACDYDLHSYNINILNIGIDFLNKLYPESDERLKVYFYMYSTDTIFWKWFISEWYQWQGYYIIAKYKNKEEITRESLLRVMNGMATENYIEESFYCNYLKIKDSSKFRKQTKVNNNSNNLKVEQNGTNN